MHGSNLHNNRLRHAFSVEGVNGATRQAKKSIHETESKENSQAFESTG